MPFDGFIAAARSFGLVIEGAPVASGKVQRVKVEGANAKDRPGWYSLHADEPGRAWAVFGDWRRSHEPPENWQEGGTAKPLSPAERAARERATHAADEARNKAQAAAAAKARHQWESYPMADASHGYLSAKGILPHGARLRGGLLVIPLRDAAGAMLSLQTVAPNGEKRFLSDGRTTGAFAMLGNPEGAEWLLIAEGFATAASLHEATGRPAAAAMNAGNLAPVAAALAQRHPTARILVCGDDDARTERKTGRNPGREAAQAAARGVAGWSVFPGELPADGSDFNDLHAVAGLPAVREQIEASIANAAASAMADDGTPPAMPAALPSAPPPIAATPSAPPQSTAAGRFSMDLDGSIYRIEPGKNDAPDSRVWVCSPIRILARTRDASGEGWGYFAEVEDPESKPHRVAIPARMLSGDGAELRGWLMDLGLRLAPGPKARESLMTYIQTSRPDRLVRCVDRGGWHGAAFVLPSRTLGAGDEPVIFQAAGAVSDVFKSRGTVEEWRERVGVLCIGNSRLLVAVSAALAGSLLSPAGFESFGLHWRGSSSSGKTTLLRVAASLWGKPTKGEYLQTWRATANALEGLAATHSDAFLALDELAELDPKEAVAVAYALGNGSGKARASRTGGAVRERLRWTLSFQSSGELSFEAHAKEAGKRMPAGAEVRCVDIPAEVEGGHGCFADLHGCPDGGAFASQVGSAAREVFGVVGPAFVDMVAPRIEELGEATRRAAAEFVKANTRAGASGQVSRVAQNLGVTAFAGELATSAGLTGWAKGDATAAAVAVLKTWIGARGGDGNSEERRLLQQVRRFFEQHGEAKFSDWHRSQVTDSHAPKTMYQVGWRRWIKVGEDGSVKIADSARFDAEGFRHGEDPADDGLTREHVVFNRAFDDELVVGFDPKFARRVLLARGWLRGEKDGDKMRAQRKERLPGERESQRVYVFTESARIADI